MATSVRHQGTWESRSKGTEASSSPSGTCDPGPSTSPLAGLAGEVVRVTEHRSFQNGPWDIASDCHVSELPQLVLQWFPGEPRLQPEPRGFAQFGDITGSWAPGSLPTVEFQPGVAVHIQAGVFLLGVFSWLNVSQNTRNPGRGMHTGRALCTL